MTAALAWIHLTGIFFKGLALSVRDVAELVLRPQKPFRSAIVAVPLDLRSDEGITMLANMITLTPGTTTLHVSKDRSVLYAHVMNASDDSVRQIKEGFERRLREVLP